MGSNNVKLYNEFNTSLLLNYELSEFYEIHNKLIPKRNKKMNTYEIRISNPLFNFTTYKKSTLNKNKEEKHSELQKLISNNAEKELVKPILDKALNILKENNIYNIDPTKYCVEFQQRNCGFEKKKYKWSAWHYDDYGSVNYKVHTIIFYLRKDKTVRGGNLEYKLNNKLFTHYVKLGDIVQFSGDIYHKPQPTSGFGCRDIIVVFIKRTN